MTNNQMKKTFILLSLLSLLAGCRKEAEVKPEDVALQAAKVYYDQLLGGDYDSFVDGMNMNDTVVPAYREQLITNMKMFIGQQEKEHKGIDQVKTIRAVADSVTNTVEAFLLFCYKDSTKEQVVVPMVEKNGIWMMK